MSSFIPQEFVRKKRENQPLAEEDIQAFVAGITDGSVTDSQISAFAMAVFFNGMSAEEGAALTLSMRDSGDVMDWGKYGFDKGAPIVDKHSTGGVGDKVSLMLAPIVAACGGFVPMISGRGLGHTGGTLDKFEAIPGYDPYPDGDKFAEIVRTVGCSIIGQTGSLAPADKRFYSIRDVTATVESIPLITASILSKKLAAGLNALVMDVKFGSGAFMPTYEKSKELATNIARVATAAGTPTTALLTDMNEVLGTTAGNAVEVIEAIEFLTNPLGADLRLRTVTIDLAAHMLMLAGLDESIDSARARSNAALTDGKAAEVFEHMVAAQGGPNSILSSYAKDVTVARESYEIIAPTSGFVSAIDTRAVGMAVVALGGGRTDPAARIDHGVGFTDIAGLGRAVQSGEAIARVFCNNSDQRMQAEAAFLSAVTISEQAPQATPVVSEVIKGK